MSYEGHYQLLCKNGHYLREGDHLGNEDQLDTCPSCKEPIVWVNSVDDTNCDMYGYIDMELFLDQPAKTQKCNLGHHHQIELPRFRIPTDEEMKQFPTRGWGRRKDDSEMTEYDRERGWIRFWHWR